MSTRSAILAQTPDGYIGVYHHWDGYPEGLGCYLFESYNSFFDRRLNRMIQFLILDHPAGWSTIVNRDFNLPIPKRELIDLEPDGAPLCFCHWMDDAPQLIDFGNAASYGCEWLYLLTFDCQTEQSLLKIYRAYSQGEPMIGMFGYGDANAQWREIATVALDGKEPDWQAMEQGARQCLND